MTDEVNMFFFFLVLFFNEVLRGNVDVGSLKSLD